MISKLKEVVRGAYTNSFNPFVGLFERIFAIWFLVAVFFGLPMLVIGWITQEHDILEMSATNIILGCFYPVFVLRSQQ